jgi:hypothetical protein
VAGAGPDRPDRLAGPDTITDPHQGLDRLVGRPEVAMVDGDHAAPGKCAHECNATIPSGAHAFSH